MTSGDDLRGKIALTGATGLLGGAFRARLVHRDVTCLDRDALDVRAHPRLLAHLRELRPALVIHCAADTNVEAAEQNPMPAFAANAVLPGLLAQACRDVDALMVQFSSTGCYGTYRSDPYDDFDELRPTTVHHRAKAAGEVAVRDAGCRALILRVGWLFGGDVSNRRNFVWNRIKEARGNPEMASDPHQTGSPTWAEDVVTQTLSLISGGVLGTFNCVNTGAVSRFGYVQKIVDLAGEHSVLVPKEFRRAAKVSPNEAAVNLKLDALALNDMPDWETSLARYVAELLATGVAA